MKLFLTLLASVAIAIPVRAEFFTNSASADSFTRSNAPTLNYGGAGSLSVSGPTATTRPAPSVPGVHGKARFL